MTIVNRVFKVFEGLDIDCPSGITLQHKLKEDLGMDSQEMVVLTLGLQKEFNVTLAGNSIQESMIVDDIVKLIQCSCG